MRSLYTLAFFTSIVMAGPLELVESDVYETAGTPAEIISRGQSCIAQLVRNDAASITGSTDDSLTAAFGDPYRAKVTAQQIPGGPIITAVTADTVVANNRLDFQWKRLLTFRASAQSTLTLLARDGRFKLLHTAIRVLNYDSGIVENHGYQAVQDNAPIAKRAGVALAELSAQIAACIQSAPSSDW